MACSAEASIQKPGSDRSIPNTGHSKTVFFRGGLVPILDRYPSHSIASPERRAKAEKGDAEAQFFLGWFYESGREMDRTEALKWIRKSAGQNYFDAQAELGNIYARGVLVAKDEAEAANWYLKAAEQGDWFSQIMLGDMYSNGNGVPKDEVEAGQWYRKAAEQDYGSAQFHFGNMCADGKGVPKDEVEAYKWLLLAAAHKHEKAKQAVELLEPKLTSEQRAEGQRMAREFKPKSEWRKLRGLPSPAD